MFCEQAEKAENTLDMTNEENDIKNADLVITVTSNHAKLIRNSFPQFGQKVYCASEITDGRDVSDPYGGNLEVYRTCAGQIMDLCKILYKKIKVL